MRHHYDGALMLVRQSLEKLDDGAATGGIERGGGFIGQQESVDRRQERGQWPRVASAHR